jgi:hypothetical protein
MILYAAEGMSNHQIAASLFVRTPAFVKRRGTGGLIGLDSSTLRDFVGSRRVLG